MSRLIDVKSANAKSDKCWGVDVIRVTEGDSDIYELTIFHEWQMSTLIGLQKLLLSKVTVDKNETDPNWQMSKMSIVKFCESIHKWKSEAEVRRVT